MQKEIWKDIKGYEGFYQISNQGRVKSLDRVVDNHSGFKRKIKGKILNLNPSGNGYYVIRLCKNAIYTKFFLHRLVVSHFIKEIPYKHDVNHINSLRTDNRLENLEIVNRRENCAHSVRKRKDVASNYPGVIKNRKKWGAVIFVNKECVWLGSFETEIDAYEAYKKACKQHNIKNKYA